MTFSAQRGPGLRVIRIAVLMTCYNRREKTLACLRALKEASRATAGIHDTDVYLVDDGCTDGTADAVTRSFPDVRIVMGTGELYWCGGMRLAWREAAKRHYDAYVWLNDDVVLFEEALTSLLDTFERQKAVTGVYGIVVGSMVDSGGSKVTYGAVNKQGPIEPTREPLPVTHFNGNLVLVSAEAFDVLGNLSSWYRHGFGDMDYGCRAKAAGVPVWLAAGYAGVCNTNPPPRWCSPKLSLWNRLKALHAPTGCPPWELARFLYVYGAWWAPWSIAKIYWKTFFPKGREPS
jgi:GT2 family glycosyltransferase